MRGGLGISGLAENMHITEENLAITALETSVTASGAAGGEKVVANEITTVREIIYGMEQLELNNTDYGLGISQVGSHNNDEGIVKSNVTTVNSTEQVIDSFYFYETEQFAVLWILLIVIVLGNTAVLITLFLNKNRKSRMNFFIKQLAIADLSVGLLSVLTDIVQRITISWLAGNIACKVIRFVQVWVTYASTYVLVALSIDRYDAITHPMNFSGCWKRAKRLVATAWGFSAVFSSPMFYLYEERVIQDQLQCWIDLGDAFRWQLYMCWVATSLFVIPAFIISACYVIIIKTIWSKGSMLAPVGGKCRYQNGSADFASRRASSRGIIPRAKVKTVKMTIVIVIVFVLCWSPYIVFDLLQVFEQIPRTQTNIAIATFIQSLAPLNSAANPLIYCVFSTHFVRTLKRLPPFRWLFSSGLCCSSPEDASVHSGCRQSANGSRLRNQHSSDSMRTLTTSLTVSARRSTTLIRTPRVIV
ncbi:cardioacceleratory peptide receptor-like isoform X1 [Toxorhynchites rutilus septentrionalis]|uniref:cardioacceleratory peptide receptor-like isoform X1 n=1 Tax=Toxorhynchites rutilus septentrionalis TaxID=329112 RepID=UPI002478BAF9|nr:cardioacceleratory peptide receptor-like isoform X1 [Toxorhynchites rutilus septentrionalis]XP_055636994.1 cardioacceleratory peptide receptor-like isoform X1 [Toxorhynchites rutilus septentrionalis]XP_055636995.1 cardioacceleratory peptide receptor-like isoform X1 [Toxorhynchites rutilus septentrionalis]XP_055636996.1 cardioacceleratory peptide receptor-like isoform X1 [Toxorhynchites rutilus septentrionalis]